MSARYHGPTCTQRDRIYLNGEWVTSSSAAEIAVLDPTTAEAIGSVPAGSGADASLGVAAARAAFADWSQRPPAERGEYLDRIAGGLERRSDELAELIAHDVGMPKAQCADRQIPVYDFRGAAELARTYPFETVLGQARVLREPVGVVAAITPWNFPLSQIAAKVAPALASGCTVVLKPSEVAPLSAFVLAEIIDEVGLPR